MNAICRPPCGNISQPMPPFPPGWNGGTGPTPPDPNTPYVFCPTIPSTAVAGSADGTVRVTGQNFTNGMTVFMDNVAMPTTFVSAAELTFQAPHSGETTAHTETIQVRDGATVIAQTCQFTYTAAPLMVLTCPLVPASVEIGAVPLTVRANGQNFTTNCVGTMDGADLPTQYVSPTQLNLTIDPSAETVRQAIIGVRDTVTGAVSTVNCPFDFLQTVLVPTLTSVTPDFVGLNDPVHTIVFIGTNFNANSVVWRGGLPLPTQFISPTQLDVLTSALTATTGTFEMRVANGTGPNTEFSNAIQAQCVNNPVLNMLVPVSTPAGGPAVFEVKLLGQNFGNTAEVMVNGVATPTRWVSGGDVRFDVNAATATAGNTLNVSVRLGHQHGATHDNVVPQPAKTLPFNFT